MSNRERCIAILDTLDESQLDNIVTMLQAVKNAIDDAANAVYHESIYQEHQIESDSRQS